MEDDEEFEMSLSDPPPCDASIDDLTTRPTLHLYFDSLCMYKQKSDAQSNPPGIRNCNLIATEDFLGLMDLDS